ncbi:hypothetical protein BH23PLA1_BH23PLA1_06840 [soil metagenome]
MATDTPNASDLSNRIEAARRDLLDLSARNRLINTPRGSSRGRKIEIVEERAENVFRLLVREQKALTFLPAADESEEVKDAEENLAEADIPHLEQPEEDAVGDGRETASPRQTDLRLQTRLSSEHLQSRLLAIYYDAQTFEQEQGVSILYLALGFLKWFEDDRSDKARYAPLLLIPVDLERVTAASRFHLRYREEDVSTNLSLQAKLKAEFGIELPDVPDLEELSPSAYLDEVTRAVAGQERWEVLGDDMVLWFFSFAKFLMYRDLDPDCWPEGMPLGKNPMLSSLLGEGFVTEPALCGNNDPIDPLIPPAEMVHVTDADSSQAVVIEEARRGRNLVVQGPPGTGKSQTITNIIGAAVKQGKKVLFVAEKMAALEVVHGRLERLGLGSLCLELHSHKANKKEVLQEIGRTLTLGRPKLRASQERIESLQQAIQRLNDHAAVMNTPLDPAGVTPFQIIGRLAHFYGRGIKPTRLTLTESETWNSDKFQDLLQEINNLHIYMQSIGPPSEHPWRGINRVEPILPVDRLELLSQIKETAGPLSTVLDAGNELSEILGLPTLVTSSLKDLKQVAQFAEHLVQAPAMDRQAILDPVWQDRRAEIDALLRQGQTMTEGRSRLDGIVAMVAWETDLAEVRKLLSAHGRSFWRWFRKDYRQAVATLRGILKTDPLRGVDERLAIVDTIIEVQAITRSLDNDPTLAQLGSSAFGNRWNGARTDWPALAEILRWENEDQEAGFPWDARKALARLERPEACQNPLETVKAQLKPAFGRLRQIAKTLNLNGAEAFGAEALNTVSTRELIDRLQQWQEHPEALSKWIGFQVRRRRLEEADLGSIVAELHEGRIAPESAVEQFEMAYYQTLIREAFRRYPGLAEFDGQSHERWIEEFRNLDQARIAWARAEVATAHHDGLPRFAVGGDMAILRREIEKKRRHKPIRQLLKEAGSAILAIKPVFMMSPISVAQYLEPGSVTFDLLLIDEASQVRPVDALGAMARAQQVVVVGDDKQLPPTRFFNKLLEAEGQPAAADDWNTSDLESVLGLCVSQGMSQRMLLWHYRSHHHSLISVSNYEFYENRLHVIPSPTTVPDWQGLHFHPVRDGVFDRGQSATNRVEAQAIALAVIEHAKRFPARSLGVGTFSISQRDAIRDELEALLREHVELVDFFSPGRPEPFFVKNLENIQGDERDVIFISIGYARDMSGSMAMNFGPLSVDGGERRLNVLISRARERCEVFSSITANDIDLERARSRGASAFKTFLRYAETRILDTQGPTVGDHDSDFEQQVDLALTGQGFEIHRQVGTAGFRIDLAVVDPNCPGRYLLGIECDGATYHSSRSARDRDRLREAVLRDRGWRLHRIWSTDWFHRPNEQLDQVLQAIEEARLEANTEAQKEEVEQTHLTTEGDDDFDREDPKEKTEAEAAWVSPYVEATFDVPVTTPIHLTSPSVLLEHVSRVVEIEGPIHREEINRRLTALWGLQRTGSRISATIGKAIDEGLHSGVLQAEKDFVMLGQQSAGPVRDRSRVASESLRKPEMIPPAEIRQAITHLVNHHVGIRRVELAPMVARTFGFKATSPRLREEIEEALKRLLEAGKITAKENKLFIK